MDEKFSLKNLTLLHDQGCIRT